MKVLKTLMCKVSQDVYGYDSEFVGQTVKVTEIERQCWSNGFLTTCVLEDGKTKRRFYSESLIPIDTSMVPPTHSTNRLLTNVWIFVEARNDAWNRDQKPPEDLAKYRDDYGTDWKDKRIFDIKQL
jgi:hypothetical protein